MTSPEEVLSFWFGDEVLTPDTDRMRLWFNDDDMDRRIRERFYATWEQAAAGVLDGWAVGDIRSRLALVIVLDQFSRNLHRGDARSFSQDPRAQELVLESMELGHDLALAPLQALFFYLPLEHAESRELQAKSVDAFEDLHERVDPAWQGITGNLLTYAQKHRAIVDRFGRFPHRNPALGRETTPEEQAFLDEHGRGF